RTDLALSAANGPSSPSTSAESVASNPHRTEIDRCFSVPDKGLAELRCWMCSSSVESHIDFGLSSSLRLRLRHEAPDVLFYRISRGVSACDRKGRPEPRGGGGGGGSN